MGDQTMAVRTKLAAREGVRPMTRWQLHRAVNAALDGHYEWDDEEADEVHRHPGAAEQRRISESWFHATARALARSSLMDDLLPPLALDREPLASWSTAIARRPGGAPNTIAATLNNVTDNSMPMRKPRVATSARARAPGHGWDKIIAEINATGPVVGALVVRDRA
jgi:hypothetical protein